MEDHGDVVQIAVAPVLARFSGANDGVAGNAGVRGGVPVGGAVAAADVTARLAHAQVHPPTTAREALLAASNGFGQLRELDVVEMRAASGHCATFRARRRTNESGKMPPGTMSERMADSFHGFSMSSVVRRVIQWRP
jgi:hypothetical protein